MVGHAQRRRLHAAERERRKREIENHKGLLSLPPELRNYIYELVLPKGQIFDIYGGWRYTVAQSSDGMKVREFKDKQLPIPGREALMKVCRQLQAETTRFFYGNNSFELLVREDTLCRTLSWLRSRPPEVFSVLRSVIIEDMHDCLRDPDSSHYCSWMVMVDLETLRVEALGDEGSSGWTIHCDECQAFHCEVVSGIERHRLFRKMKDEWRYGEMRVETVVELVRKLRFASKSWR